VRTAVVKQNQKVLSDNRQESYCIWINNTAIKEGWSCYMEKCRSPDQSC